MSEALTPEEGEAAIAAMKAGTDIPGEGEGGDMGAPQVDYVETYDPENPTEMQQKALDMGWNPEGVEGKDSIGSGEFVRNKSFFDEIHKLKRETRKATESVKKLVTANAKAKQQGKEEAIAELKAKRKLAAEDNDIEEVLNITEQIEEKQQEVVEEETPDYETANQALIDAGNDFIAKTDWYKTDEVKRAYADQQYTQFVQANVEKLATGEMEPQEVFEHINKKVSEQFQEKPDDGDGKPRSRVSEGGKKPSTSRGSGKKYTLADIPEEGREIARDIIRDGSITEEDYVKAYLEVE